MTHSGEKCMVPITQHSLSFVYETGELDSFDSFHLKMGRKFFPRIIVSSSLLRIMFSGFTHVFSLAMEDIISLLSGVVFATLVGL